MPYPTDESEPDALPDPELNPLLNPLLAAHMGRWAEVYFTNPPERRRAAVAQLLRELQANSSSDVAAVAVVVVKVDHEQRKEPSEAEPQRDGQLGYEHKTNDAATASNLSSFAAEAPSVCSACGHENAPGHNFCGMCGTPNWRPRLPRGTAR